MDHVVVEVRLSVPASRVWRAWTEEEQVTAWFSPEARIEPRPGGPFELFFDPSEHDHQSTKGCVFTEIHPKSSLAFTWKGPDQFAQVMNDPGRLTHVRVSFREDEEATSVVLEHSGWRRGSRWSQARSWHEAAWKEALGELKRVLESGVEEDKK
jgi:uncharacterized protein YndB with AHSA1/START domain